MRLLEQAEKTGSCYLIVRREGLSIWVNHHSILLDTSDLNVGARFVDRKGLDVRDPAFRVNRKIEIITIERRTRAGNKEFLHGKPISKLLPAYKVTVGEIDRDLGWIFRRSRILQKGSEIPLGKP